MSYILSKKILIALIAVAIITTAFFVINKQSQADEEYQFAVFGYAYVDGVKTVGVQIKLNIDGEVYETESIGLPDSGSFNIGHYRDTGEYCLTGTYQDGGSEKRDAHQGNKTQTGTIQQDLYLTGTGPNCIGQ